MNTLDRKLMDIQLNGWMFKQNFCKIQNVLAEVLSSNPSKDLPYHGNDHLMNVVRTVYLLMSTGGENSRDICIVMMAAIWHDYDHSGGAQSDSLNVARAAAHAHRYFSQRPSLLESLDSTPEYICSLIEGTEFPYGEEAPKSTHMKYLRDADILSSFNGDSGAIAVGLYNELGAAGKLGDRYPSEECALTFMANRRKFLTDIQIFTPVGNTVRASLFEEVLEAQELAFDELVNPKVKKNLARR